jgi:hypothetical protein
MKIILSIHDEGDFERKGDSNTNIDIGRGIVIQT